MRILYYNLYAKACISLDFGKLIFEITRSTVFSISCFASLYIRRASCTPILCLQVLSAVTAYLVQRTRGNKQGARVRCIPAIRDFANRTGWLAGWPKPAAARGNRGIVFVGHVAWILMCSGT